MIFKKTFFYIFLITILGYFFYNLNYFTITLKIMKFNGFKYSNIELYKENNNNSLYIKDLYYLDNKIVDEIKVKFSYIDKLIIIDKIYIKNIKYDLNSLFKDSNEGNNNKNYISLTLLNIMVEQIRIKKLYLESSYFLETINENIKFNGVTKNININIQNEKITLENNIKIESFVKLFNKQTMLNINIKENFDIHIKMKNQLFTCNMISNNIQNTLLFNIKTKSNELLKGVNQELSFLNNSKLINIDYEITGIIDTKKQEIKNLNILNLKNDDNFLIKNIQGDFSKISLKKSVLDNLSIKILDRKISFSNKTLDIKNVSLINMKKDFKLLYDIDKKIININFKDFYIMSKKLGIKRTIINGDLSYFLSDKKIVSNLKFKDTFFKPNIEIEKNILDRIEKKEINMSNDITLKKELKKKFPVNFDLNFNFKKSHVILSNIEANNDFDIEVRNLNPGLFYKGVLNIKKGSINIESQKMNMENSFIFLDSRKGNSLNLNFNKKIEDIILYGNIYGALSKPSFDLYSNSNLSEKEIAILLLKNKEVLNTFQQIKNTKDSNAKLNTSVKSSIMIFNLFKNNFINILGINIDKIILDSKINNFTNTEEVMINIEKKINKKIIFKYEKIGNEINSYDVNYKVNKNISFDFEHVEEYGNSHQGIFVNFEN